MVALWREKPDTSTLQKRNERVQNDASSSSAERPSPVLLKPETLNSDLTENKHGLTISADFLKYFLFKYFWIKHERKRENVLVPELLKS